MNCNEVVLHLPGGVTANQWKDGSVHLRCGPAGYMPLAQLFHQLSVQCQVYSEAFKTQTAVETQRQTEAPAPTIEGLQAEIDRLRGVGVPVSVNTNPALTAAQQLAAIVHTRVPVSVAQPGPSLLEVATALSTRNVQHPVAAAAAVAVPMPIIPPANVPPQPAPPPFVQIQDTAHQNTGPALATPTPRTLPPERRVMRLDPREARIRAIKRELAALEKPIEPVVLEPDVIHKPVLLQPAEGIADPSAPETIVSGGREADDGILGPPPEGL